MKNILMKLTIPTIMILLITLGCTFKSTDPQEFNGRTIRIESTDNIQVLADIYDKGMDKNSPFILLFHQAGYSRGEYRPSAEKLNSLGFRCLAIDQRSGSKVNGIINETAKQARDKGIGTDYVDALPDLRTAIEYTIKEFNPEKMILLGSSYSSSLIFILGNEYKESVDGLIAFSPGEYFEYKNKTISEYAAEIECPVFVTSAGNEKESWENIYKSVKSEKKHYLPDFKGKHGSKALWESSEGSEKYWNELLPFLNKYVN